MCAHSINSPFKRQPEFHGRPDVIQKDCDWCGGEIVLHPGDSLRKFKRNRCCSPQCSRALSAHKQRKDLESKVCPVCGNAFTRSSDEPAGNYRKRATCSIPCSYAYRAKKKRIFHERAALGIDPDTVKACAVCGESFRKRDDVSNSDFERQVTCASPECRGAAIGSSRIIPLPTKTCKACGAELSQIPGESQSLYRARKTCGGECRWEAARIERMSFERSGIDPKPCPICGVVMVCGDDELPWMFRRRRTCGDKDCRYQQMIRSTFGYTERRSPYPREWTVALKNKIKARDGNKCAKCGDSESQLHVHHINYIKQDCRTYNLVTLCIRCHGMMGGGDKLRWKEECRGYVDLILRET